MLTRWDPFQEMLNLRRTVDRLNNAVQTMIGVNQHSGD
jgi:hypothetical protein